MSAEYKDFFAIRDEIMSQLNITDMNIGEKAIKLPAIKQYWIAKMIQCKIEIRKLEDLKKKAISKFMESQTEIKFDKAAMMKLFNSSSEAQKLNDRIDELNIIVEYLNEAKFALGRVTDDIKNKIELDKLERL